MLKFSFPKKEDIPYLLQMTKNSIQGTEVFTFLTLHSEGIPEGSVFCGRDERGEIKSLVFNNSDRYIPVFGEEFPEIFTYEKKCLMIYDADACSASDSDSLSCCSELSGRDILSSYTLFSEGELSDADEKRYVYKMRSVNHGMAKVLGIKRDGALISTACISASNLSYALIADVFTLSSERKKGLAAICVKKCVSLIKEKGLTPYLLCDDKMCPYYEKLGFIYHGKM